MATTPVPADGVGFDTVIKVVAVTPEQPVDEGVATGAAEVTTGAEVGTTTAAFDEVGTMTAVEVVGTTTAFEVVGTATAFEVVGAGAAAEVVGFGAALPFPSQTAGPGILYEVYAE